MIPKHVYSIVLGRSSILRPTYQVVARNCDEAIVKAKRQCKRDSGRVLEVVKLKYRGLAVM